MFAIFWTTIPESEIFFRKFSGILWSLCVKKFPQQTRSQVFLNYHLFKACRPSKPMR